RRSRSRGRRSVALLAGRKGRAVAGRHPQSQEKTNGRWTAGSQLSHTARRSRDAHTQHREVRQGQVCAARNTDRNPAARLGFAGRQIAAVVSTRQNNSSSANGLRCHQGKVRPSASRATDASQNFFISSVATACFVFFEM